MIYRISHRQGIVSVIRVAELTQIPEKKKLKERKKKSRHKRLYFIQISKKTLQKFAFFPPSLYRKFKFNYTDQKMKLFFFLFHFFVIQKLLRLRKKYLCKKNMHDTHNVIYKNTFS